MFRAGLLVSTAMTAVALLLSGADAAQAQTNMHVTSDPNTRFLCTYGEFEVYAYHSGSSAYSSSGWAHVAVPITGHGQIVRRIRVVEAQGRFSSGSSFSVGIYSNTASGLPGDPIAVGKGTIESSCGPVKVSIPATRLASGRTYWIEETTPMRGSRETSAYWLINPKARRRAYRQVHRWAASSGHSIVSYTTPWTRQSYGPYVYLR